MFWISMEERSHSRLQHQSSKRFKTTIKCKWRMAMTHRWLLSPLKLSNKSPLRSRMKLLPCYLTYTHCKKYLKYTRIITLWTLCWVKFIKAFLQWFSAKRIKFNRAISKIVTLISFLKRRKKSWSKPKNRSRLWRQMKTRRVGMCTRWPSKLMTEMRRLNSKSKRFSATTKEQDWCSRSRWLRERKDPSLIWSLMETALSLSVNLMSAEKYTRRMRNFSLPLMSLMRTWLMANSEKINSCSSCIYSSRWDTPSRKSLKEKSKMFRLAGSRRTLMMSIRWCTHNFGKSEERLRKRQS